MKTILRRVIALTLCITICSAVPAFAAWRDRSGNLPGLVSGKSIAIGGAISGAFVVGLLMWGKHRDKALDKMDFQAPRKIDFKASEYKQTVTLKNTGTQDLSLSGVGFGGKGYSSTIKIPALLRAGSKIDLEVERSQEAKKKAQLRLSALGGSDGKSRDREVEIHVTK